MAYDKTEKAAQQHKEAVQNQKDAGTNLWNAIGEYVGSTGKEIAAELNVAGTAVAETGENAWNSISNAANYVGGKIEQGVDYVGDKVKDGVDAAGKAAETAWNNGWSAVEDVAQAAQGKKPEKTLSNPATMAAATGAAVEKATATATANSTHAETKTADKQNAEKDAKANEAYTPRTTEKETTEKDAKAEEERLNGLFKDTLAGKYGVGDERKEALGDDYAAVQNRINDYYKQKANTELGVEDITNANTKTVDLEAGE